MIDIKRNKKIILGILILLFVLITFLVKLNLTKSFDDSIYRFLIDNRSNSLDIFFKTITKFGNSKTIILLVLIILLVNRKKEGLNCCVLAISSVLTMSIIKVVIKRARPDHLRLITETNYSFPSGHAMIAICIYGYLLYLVYTRINNKIIKYWVSIILFLLIILIGLSRVYLGVHYPSDIIGGYLLSLIIFIIVIDKTKTVDKKVE